MCERYKAWPLGGVLCLLAGSVTAATLSSQSSVGVSAEYASNPFLLAGHAQPAEALALVADLPATYTSDTQSIELIPRLRQAQPFGPVGLLSDYQYLDGDWHWKSERNAFSATGGWHHDSTYYNEFEQAALLGHDLKRLEVPGSLSWDRQLSERNDLQLSASYDRVAYSQHSASAVSNFSYAQGALQFSRLISERTQWTSSLGYGSFQLLAGSYFSTQRFAQTAVTHQWSERWTTNAQVGYAYLNAHGIGEQCCELALSPNGTLELVVVPVRQYAARGSPNFAVTVQRQAERFGLDLNLSRAIQPSGFGALITEDTASLSATRAWSERWTVAGTLQWSRLLDSLGRLSLDNRQYYSASLSAGWQWTEHWTLQLQGGYTRQYLESGLPPSAGVTVYLNLLRQLAPLRL